MPFASGDPIRCKCTEHIEFAEQPLLATIPGKGYALAPALATKPSPGNIPAHASGLSTKGPAFLRLSGIGSVPKPFHDVSAIQRAGAPFISRLMRLTRCGEALL